jgi:hypothetical protein
MKIFKIFLFFSLSFVCIFISVFGLGRLNQYLSGGFRIDKIKVDLGEAKESYAKTEIIKNILNQTFTYLDKGSQTYVFLSEDKKYVIKFIRYSRYRIPFWMNHIPYNTTYRTSRMLHKNKRYKDSIFSYQLADKYLRKETLIVYSHLNKTKNLNQKLTLKDKLGRGFIIDLDNFGFIIQKKVTPLIDYLLEQKKENKLNVSRKIVRSFLQMINDCYDKGIEIKDYNCIKNAGFFEGKVINLDLGSFYKKDGLDQVAIFEKELYHFTQHFRKWAVKKFPEILSIFEEECKLMINQKKNISI